MIDTSSKRTAFTLIELLVVIAIIAILAAILFPVFASAKESAKNTQTLSGTKQLGLANLMYAADSDDAFVLAQWAQGPVDWDTWQGTLQPYMKTWQIVEHPKLPKPSGPNAYWTRIQHFGVPVRYVATRFDPADYPWTNSVSVLAKGAGEVKFDGIFGSGVNTAVIDWENRQTAPSLTQSNIEEISSSVMMVEANNWDLRWGGGGFPLFGCGRYGAPDINGDGNTNWKWNGPTSYTRPINGRRGESTGCNLSVIPDGLTTYVATDGSARAVDYRGRLFEVKELANGSFAFKNFWPNG